MHDKINYYIKYNYHQNYITQEENSVLNLRDKRTCKREWGTNRSGFWM